MTKSPWGALPADWHLLDLGLGLTADLLPVVSNPNAKISENSLMKGVGKTPSRYNGNREAVGIPQWTQKQATDADITRWSKEEDYGICIQTRQVRAIDIDVDDRELARKVVEAIGAKLDSLGRGELRLPVRSRANSGKCLLAFRLMGHLPKRILRVDVEKHYAIEFLGNGQQFVAHGTHPSGARYEWDRLEEFPELTLEQFEAIWAALVEQFGDGDAVVVSGAARKRGQHLAIGDDVATKLDVLGEGNDGQLYIECPFSANHSSDTGIGQTVYFPAGTGGYERGHFHCLHASCQHQTDTDFLVALGIDDRQDDLDDLTAPQMVVDEVTGDAVEETLPEPLPLLLRDSKGAPLAIPANVRAVVERADVIGIHIRHDAFRDEIMYAKVDDPKGWRTFSDNDYTRLRIQFDRMGSKPVGRELVRDAVALVAEQHQFDSAIEWLGSLKWDGVPRVARFAVDYLGVSASEYATALSLYLWTALAGRVLVPGIQMRMAPIFVGAQNIGKSTVIKAMSPDPQFFCEIDLKADDDTNARRMRGKVVAELAELKGLASRDLEGIKAFISRSHEQWVPKYKEFTCTYARRLVFIGTSNEDEFLADSTGNTRWLPIKVGDCDVAGVERDKLQLWAEAAVLFKEQGILWREALKLGTIEHEAYTMADAWHDAVAEWLGNEDDMGGGKPSDREWLTLNGVAREALNIDIGREKGRFEIRLGNTLKKLGYEKHVRRINGKNTKVWAKELA